MEELKIGLKVQASIYVTLKGLNIVVPMDASLFGLVNNIEGESGSVIWYNGTDIKVCESVGSIERALYDANYYKDEAKKYVSSLLENKLDPKEEIKNFVLSATESGGTNEPYRKYEIHIQDAIKGFVVFSIIVDNDNVKLSGVNINGKGDTISDKIEYPLEWFPDDEIRNVLLVLKNRT